MAKNSKTNSKTNMQFDIDQIHQILFKYKLHNSLLLFLLISSFFSLLWNPISAMNEIPRNITMGELIVEIAPNEVQCNTTPCTYNFNVNVTNPSPENLTLFFTEKKKEYYKVMAEVGDISGFQTKEFNFTLKFMYAGITNYIGGYAIISDRLSKDEFIISEDWSNYEKIGKDIFFYSGFVVAPVLALVLIFLLYLVARVAGKRKDSSLYPNEYTTKTLFALPTSGPIVKRIVLLLSNPIIWIFIVLLTLLLLSLVFMTEYEITEPLVVTPIIISAFVAAFFVPVILLILSWYADFYEREPLRFVIGMFMWGILASFLAFFFNTILLLLFGQHLMTAPLLLITVFVSLAITPIVEETVKGIGLVILSAHHEFDDMLDGLLYGFAIGIGFASIENLFYFISKVDPLTLGFESWFFALLYRSFFNTIAHGCFTGFIGAIIGMMRSRPIFKDYSYLAIFPGLFVAILLHLIFNLTAFLDVVRIEIYSKVIFSFSPIFVLISSVGFLIVYYFGLKETKTRMGGLKKTMRFLSE